MLSEAKGAMGRIGRELLDLAKHILYLRKQVRDGTLLWQTFQRRMEPPIQCVETLLEKGARYVERILTACTTCRLQGRSVIQHLRDTCHCYLNGVPVPALIKTPGCLPKSA